MSFMSKQILLNCSWQAFERLVSRLLVSEGYNNVRIVGGSGDKGADILASKFGKRWLFQVKHWKKPVGIDVVQETLKAQKEYKAQIPVIVSVTGFEASVIDYQKVLLSQGISLQLWTVDNLEDRAERLRHEIVNQKEPRDYQKTAIENIVQPFISQYENKALIVLATGLGKTFVAAEALRRINNLKSIRVLVLAHTNPLIYQLEKSFWPFLYPKQTTVIWNGYEHPDTKMLSESDFVFACIDTVVDALDRGISYDFDVIVVDECHHAGSPTYKKLLNFYNAGHLGGPFLLGLTATPWRQDESDIKMIFGEPRIQIDMIYGMNHGFLTNVDYRMHTDNINWDALESFDGKKFSPKQINKTLFINQWDDAVVEELQRTWSEQVNPRAIVFCGTIDHAITMRNKINALGFCNAAAVFTQMKSCDEKLSLYQRNRILSDFADGYINVICAVDVFNEGIDVPDVNIIVFQRVTHSRRIFIQQLGRGLRIAEDKEKVIVLDFVSDIRRFAAGLNLKDKIDGKGIRLNLPNKVSFKRVGADDPRSESFLREWLEDVATIENADEDASVLKYPPKL